MVSVSLPNLLIFLTLAVFCSLIQSEDVARIELDKLRSRISTLEKRIDESVEELNRKDDSIKVMEKNIEQKLNYIASLSIQIQSLRGGSPDAEKRAERMFGRSNELRSQADNLRNEIEAQVMKKNDLEVRAYAAEKHINELYQKLGTLQKISDEQRTMISKIKSDIHLAEERLLQVKLEASLAHAGRKQAYTILFWTEHGRSRLDWTFQKALDVEAILQEWAGPHIEAVKKKWLMVIGYLEPWILIFQNTANPYIQRSKRFLKPYLTQISVLSKPQFDIITHALMPHARHIVQIYERLMRSVMARHSQVQGSILELLRGHEYTRAFANKDLVWYLASAIFALPAILIVNLYTSLVSNKPRKHSHKPRVRRCSRANRLCPEN